jgi:hypothetical protein
MAKDPFLINPDGSILAGNQQFQDMKEYVLSDYFREQGKRCGTRTPAVQVDPQAAGAIADCTLQVTRIRDEYWLSGMPIILPVWFHVLYRSDGTGNIATAAINAQMKVLNEDYRAIADTPGSQGFDSGIQFSLAGITRTQNDLWFNDEDNEGYTQALNRDPAKNINVYVNSANGYLGYASFPQEGAGLVNDGIVMNYATIGGRNNGYQVYDQGRTLVHEMGHYLGLHHTFEGYSACNNSYSGGDLIVDTPAEAAEHYECVQTYTCGSRDPIRNYMNYTPDSCMTGFSREQANRLVCSLLNYRPALVSPGVSETVAPIVPVAPNALIPLLLRK